MATTSRSVRLASTMRAQHVAADAAEPGDCDPDGHDVLHVACPPDPGARLRRSLLWAAGICAASTGVPPSLSIRRSRLVWRSEVPHCLRQVGGNLRTKAAPSKFPVAVPLNPKLQIRFPRAVCEPGSDTSEHRGRGFPIGWRATHLLTLPGPAPIVAGVRGTAPLAAAVLGNSGDLAMTRRRASKAGSETAPVAARPEHGHGQAKAARGKALPATARCGSGWRPSSASAMPCGRRSSTSRPTSGARGGPGPGARPPRVGPRFAPQHSRRQDVNLPIIPAKGSAALVSSSRHTKDRLCLVPAYALALAGMTAVDIDFLRTRRNSPVAGLRGASRAIRPGGL